MKKHRRFQNLILIFLSLFILTSCSDSGTVTPETPCPVEEDYIKLDVPYVEQATPKWCLPASGTMILNYYGVNITQEELADIVISEDGTGDGNKMITYAKELGFKAKYCYLTIVNIKDILQKDVPILVAQDYSLTESIDHSRVVIGYDDKTQELITHDPSLGKDYKIYYSDFEMMNISGYLGKCCSTVIYPGDVNLNLP